MVFLPDDDREYLEDKKYEYQEVDEGSKRGIIIKNWKLPKGRYDAEYVDILILIPSGYPDVNLDMFYVNPWIKLVPENKFAKNADAKLGFNGITWQRWSRHNNDWRPGIDGIWTHIQKIQNALEVARV